MRVFFAIWPKDAAWRQLCDLSEKLELVCGGRRTRAESIHLTLIFLGEMETSQLDALCLAANTVKGRAFNFIVEGVRYWKFNRVVYAGTGEVPLELFDLVDSLQDTLSANGFSFDHRAFTPHITLVRKVQRYVLPKPLISLVEPIVWPVSEWILVKSEQASDRSVYTPIGRWPLVSQR
jgi:2'-5' RNA ligase